MKKIKEQIKINKVIFIKTSNIFLEFILKKLDLIILLIPMNMILEQNKVLF